MKVALLICSLEDRRTLLERLISELLKQLNQNDLTGGVNVNDFELEKEIDIGIFVNSDNRTKTTGQKRNELIDKAILEKAKYIAFIDDDDLIGETYIRRAMELYESNKDCAELWGQIYWDGKKGKPFHHFLDCEKWSEDDEFYYRTINHLNFIKLDLVKDIRFPNQNFGEDGQWSEKVKESGRLNTMMPIPEVIYHYFCGSPKQAL